MDLWNVKALAMPPMDRIRPDWKEIDHKLFRRALEEAAHFFQNDQFLNMEAALISRMIYRMKMKFRSAKDLKPIEKLNRALRNYLDMDILTSIQYVLSLTAINHSESALYPTKNTVDYLLVRLQGLGKLCFRIVETCKIAAALLQQRIRLGHFWNVALLIYAMVSRLFIISKKMMQFTCDFYGNLVPFSTKLINRGDFKWLPERYLLPHSLYDWLDVASLDLDNSVIEIMDETTIDHYFNLIDDSDDDIQISDEYVLINDSIVKDNEDSDQETPNPLKGFKTEVDIGEVVNLSDSDIDATNKNDEVITIDDSVIQEDFIPLYKSSGRNMSSLTVILDDSMEITNNNIRRRSNGLNRIDARSKRVKRKRINRRSR